MNRLARSDLMSLEQYSVSRKEFRDRVLAHKKSRTIGIGPNATWCFEDRLTVQYQIQEMLRVERIFEAAGIQDELDAYNPLIPDGSNWKATFLIEFPDPEIRKQKLATMKGIEHRCWVQVEGFDLVRAIADEDLERENEEKTSAVHFLRFELTPAMVMRAKAGATLALGIDHPNYNYEIRPVPHDSQQSLIADLG